MNKVNNNLSVIIVLLVLSLPQFSISQMTLKEKVVDVFTRKKQIIVLNHKVDSLQTISNEKDSVIGIKDTGLEKLAIDYNFLELEKDSVIRLKDLIVLRNQKLSKTLDSLKKVNEESKRYSKEQREEDSIRYQTLLQKLSDKNKFVVDSIKKINEVRRDKQEPKRIENYYFKDFKSVITGTPDTKNRFTWTFELFKKDSSGYIPANNDEVFNDKKAELLSIINERIKSDFEKAYGLDKECFKTDKAPGYTFNNLGLEFKDDKVNFYAVFDFATENCYYLYGYTVVEFTVGEVEEYIK